MDGIFKFLNGGKFSEYLRLYKFSGMIINIKRKNMFMQHGIAIFPLANVFSKFCKNCENLRTWKEITLQKKHELN